MIVGWAINSAIILLAASVFFKAQTPVSELQQASQLLGPLLGNQAALVFAVALLFSGVASSITSEWRQGLFSLEFLKNRMILKIIIPDWEWPYRF